MFLGEFQVHISHDKLAIAVATSLARRLCRLEYFVFIAALVTGFMAAKLTTKVKLIHHLPEMFRRRFYPLQTTNTFSVSRMPCFCRRLQEEDRIFKFESLLDCAQVDLVCLFFDVADYVGVFAHD